MPDTSNATGTVDAILMASGFSQRFGGDNKLLMPFRGKALARHTLELACAIPQISRVILVYADEAVAQLAADLPVFPVFNTCPQNGQCESVRLGIANTQGEHYLFFPCDQPLLDAATVKRLLALRGHGRIVCPVHGGRPGNPVLYSAAFRAELLALEPGQPARTVKNRHAAVVELEVADPLALADVDTLDEFHALEVLSEG